MRGFLPHSPFPLELGMEVVELEPDRAVLESVGGATVAMSISYMSAARAADLVAVGEVVRRGASLCFVDVIVTAGADVVAKGMVTHRYGTSSS